MAQNVIEIKIITDAKGTQVALADTGKGLNDLGKSAKDAGKSTEEAGKQTEGFGKNVLTLQSALATLGLAGIATSVISFAKESFTAAAAAERLGRATENLAQGIGSSGDAMVSAITSASNQTISKTSAMEAANKALMFGLVQNSDQMSEMTQIAVTLGAAMGQSATKSMDDLTVALGRQSPMILDNLGITLKIEEAHRIYAESIGKTVEALTEEEKKQAFVNAALIKGRERVAELGGVTLDTAGQTEQLSAAWDDFKVAFGSLLTTMAGASGILTSTVRNLEAGALAYRSVVDAASELNEVTNSLYGTAAASKSLLDSSKGLLGVFNPLAGLIGEIGNAYVATSDETEIATLVQKKHDEELQKSFGATMEASAAVLDYKDALGNEGVALTQTAIMAERYGVATGTSSDIAIDAYWDRADAAEKTAAAETKAFEDSIKAQQELTLGIATTTADYYTEKLKLESDYAASVAGIQTSSADAQATAASELSDELAKIEQERADKIAWVMTGAHARTAAENEEALAYHNAIYDEMTAAAIAKTAEKTDGIIAEQARAEASAATAREKEKAEMQAHLDELKLKTTLSMLETTGQLEQLTGLVGINAGQAAELITAGVLPVTQELGLAMQNTMATMESGMAAAATTATANQAILQEAMSGTLASTETLGTTSTTALDEMSRRYGEDIPTSIATTQTAATALTTGMATGLTTLQNDTMTPFNQSWIDLSSIHLPALQETFTATNQIMLDGLNQTLAVLQQILSTIMQIQAALKTLGAAAKEAAEEMQDGFGDAASNLKNKLVPALMDVVSYLQQIKRLAGDASGVISNFSHGDSAGGGASEFQHGTGGIRTVPAGFRNDSFRMGLTSGEQFAVAPPGMNLRKMLGLDSGMGTVINMTNNITTQQPAQAIVQSLEIARAMIPA